MALTTGDASADFRLNSPDASAFGSRFKTKPGTLPLITFLLVTSLLGVARSAEVPPVDYRRQIAPLFEKYCSACHNQDDQEGQLSLETFSQLQQGGKNGPALFPGDADSSRLIQMLTGRANPKMPPDDGEAPTAEEIELLRNWINFGAKGPKGAEPDRTRLIVPQLPAANGVAAAITAVAWTPDGKQFAAARFGEVDLYRADGQTRVRTFTGFPGKVNSVRFSADGERLFAASGVAGLFGRASIWNVAAATLQQEMPGHRDILYDVLPSPNGKLVATCSYDRRITLWDLATGQPVRTMEGHNGAVYDLAFSPDGMVLASASADETVKLWQVATGLRLDTLHQPRDAQYEVAFSPDGRSVVAGGADNRIRVWRFVSRTKPRINPLVYARFAHEGSIVSLAFSSDGKTLVSAAEDRSIKAWESETYTETHVFQIQPDVVAGLAVSPDGKSLLVGRMDGSVQLYPLPASPRQTSATTEVSSPPLATVQPAPLKDVTEQEPNDVPQQAAEIIVPATVSGVIHSTGEPAQADADLFRFPSPAGRKWVIEINAARSKSPLDSKVEVLDVDGNPIPRVLLQAVRDSYFTFRGKDSSTSDDFRLHNWEEMELNEYLYARGEVVKLWLYPPGPDSGFKVYPGRGKRYSSFGTTPISHALGEPCYVVRPQSPQATLIPNGLPLFPIYFENDDDSRRELGSDSRVIFTAPSDGEYLVRVTDVRGFHGADFKYRLTVRPARPDFQVNLDGASPTVNAGSGKEFTVTAQRIDGFDGEIRVDISGLPPGFRVTTPLVIQAGHDIAYGSLNALPDAPQPNEETAKTTQVTASALVDGRELIKPVKNLGEIKLGAKPKLLISLTPGSQEPHLIKTQGADPPGTSRPPEIIIHPGRSTTARIRVARNGFQGRIDFGKEDSGRNLPHGVYVDNIGLNGLLIPEGTTERTFFITAAKWVPETTRTFHLKTSAAGGQTSWPAVLHVRKPETIGDEVD